MSTLSSQPVDEFAIDPSFLGESFPFLKSSDLQMAKRAPTTWDAELVYDLALGIDSLDDILLRHDTDKATLSRLFDSRIFTREVAALRNELQTEGKTIKLKARMQFEGYLKKLDSIINDIDTPAATRISAIQYVGKIGAVEPVKEKVEENTATAFNIQINI